MCRKGNKKVAQSSKKKNPSNVIYEEASRYPAKITHNHLFNIYHLNEICGPNKSHPNKFKNTNCTNPFCLLKIGLERWEKFRKPPKTDEPKRDKPRDIQLQPCGLYNNANLCYLNSFLQIWYHNPHFRHFVFSYASVPTFVNPKNSSGAVIKVQKIMERLQAVFFALEVSPFEACDAVRLAEALMLQDGQQDVSEFHTLFFAFLEKQLEGHPSLPGFKKVHEKINFRMKQIIECPCKRKKVTETIVSGLHVSPEGCTNVTEMLKKCFEPAPLHGYTCPECNEESITHMRNEVGTLPPVLMIQITRVSIDHRKDRTAIIYPRELNESTLLKGSKGNHKYHLIAVCVHDGQAASSGHYYDYIYDTRRKKWFHFNDATVKSIKPPGVETEDDVIKPTSDMRGCYLLLYRRDTDLDADEDEEIPYNKLPKRAYVIEKRLGIESERLRNSNERSERYWHKRTAESLNRLEKLFNELKITTTDFVKKKPNDVVFLPIQLLLDIVDKEHKAVESMINLNKLEDTAAEERKLKRKEARAKEQADLESGNVNGKHVNHEELERLQQKYLNVELTPQMIQEIEAASNSNHRGKRNGRIKKVKQEIDVNVGPSTSYIADSSDESDVDENDEDEATYSHLYIPEKLGTYEMPICIHGKVPLMNVLKGEIKVVKKVGAEKLLENYGLKIRKRIFKHSEGTSSTMTTSTLMAGSELCVDCATDLRKEANFSERLDEVEPTVSEILKDISRQVTQDSYVTSNDFIVSRKDLSNHRKLALQQREYNKLLELDKECSILIFTTSEDEKLNGLNGIDKERTPILSPKSRKRKATNENDENEQISPKVEFMVQINPASPLKLKMIRIEKPTTNGEMTKTNGDCTVNGKIKAPVASEESNSETEEEEEMESDGEDDPDWDGHEGDCGNKRKGIRSANSTPKKKRKLVKTSKNASDTEQEIIIPKQPVYFNSNISCSHGNVLNGSKVVKLTYDEWTEIVTSFFNDPTELRGDQMLCFDCEEEKQNELMSNRQNKDILMRINADINLLLKQLEKRKFSKDELGTKFTNIICGRFLDNFKTASRSKSSSVTVPLLCQGCLICSEHGKPFVDFSKRQITGNAMPITSKEWKDIFKSYKNHFPGHDGDLVEIKLGNDGKSTNFCSTCCQQFLEKESKKKYEFVNGEIYIKVQGDDDNGGGRKSQWRPATRRAAAKNFFKVIMSSNQKVFDLKLEICERYYCVPDQQLLYNNGDVLEDDKTLEESQIAANNADNPVILIVQSREDGPREVDRGFQDTALGF